MDSEQIRLCVVPPVIGDDHPGGIHGFCQIVHARAVGLLLLAVHDAIHAPGLIKRHPGHDARMVIIPLHDFHPFRNHLSDIIPGIEISAGAFLPYQKSQPVGPVQEPLLLHLLMLPYPIEPHFLAKGDVPYQGLIVRRRHKGTAPVSLVQQHFLIIRTVVQEKCPILHADLTHGKIGIRLIHCRPFTFQLIVYIEQDRMFRRPLIGLVLPFQIQVLVQLPFPDRLSVQHGDGITDHPGSLICNLHLKPGLCFLVQEDFHANHLLVHIRRHPHLADELAFHWFKPHGLPDSGCACIENGCGFLFPELLSPGLFQVLRIVLGPYHQDILPIPEQVRDFKGKGGMSAHMGPGPFPIDPDLCLVIAGPKMKDEALPLFQCPSVNAAAVPDHIVESRVMNPGHFCLVCKRHRNLSGKRVGQIPFFLLPHILVIKPKLPLPVQVHPVFPPELGSGVFVLRYIGLICICSHHGHPFVRKQNMCQEDLGITASIRPFSRMSVGLWDGTTRSGSRAELASS